MTDEAVSPLRRRMIEDMTIRKLAPKTQRDYVQRIKNFAAFLGRSPDTATFEDVRRYQLHLAASGVGVPTLNQTVSTLRFFFRVTLRRLVIEKAFVGRRYSTVIPGRVEDANPGSRDSPMRNCASEVWSFGPSRNDDASCRWCSARRKWRGCSMPHPGSSTRRR